MAYIGREPQVGNFQVCDAISVVNGQAAYTMQVNSVNVSPETANHMLVSLNGVLQAPGSSYTVSGSTITFASNLVTGDVIDFIHILGSVLDLGVPSDSTVSLAKLTATGTKDATTFLRGDNTFAEAGGGLVQTISTTKSDTFSASLNNSFTDITGLTATITPTSSSNKVLITCSINYGSTTGYPPVFRLYRTISGGSATLIGAGTAAGSRQSANTAPQQQGASNDKNRGMHTTINFLDSPSTTSSTTYKINGGILQAAGVLQINTSGTSFDRDAVYIARTTSTITIQEVV